MSQNEYRPVDGRAAEARAAGSGSNLCQHSTTVCAAGKAVGQVRGETFFKTISGSRHLLKNPPAICFDKQSLLDARAAGALRCDIFDRESGCHYHASIDRILDRGFEFDRGFGLQIGLPLPAWVRLTRGAARQLDIFSEVGQ